MTSLKAQLNKLADAHTQWQLTESENRKRASFLYDPTVASTLDRETIYCLGTNGFEELCLLDSGFEEFENVLFSDQSLTFDRSIQSKEVNDSLNTTIQRFLIRLSPYFLLSPAHKALEWLVHRFFIHFYNIDDLMRCILPYHEHNYFVRAIQMLRLHNHQTMWNWLEPSQKAGTTIAGLVMANRCATDLGFLNFICESTDMAVKEFGNKHSSLRVMINFYLKTICSTILHSLSHVKKKKKKKQNIQEENFIAHLMPFLLKGLKSKSTDYKRATYLILSHLSNIFTFQSKIRDEILNVLSKGFADELIKENLLVVSVFLNNQHSQSIPDRCFLRLSQLSNLIDEMNQLSIDVRLDNFLCAWLDQLLRHVLQDKQSMETDQQEHLTSLMEKTLNTIKLNSSILKFLLHCFLQHFNANNQIYLVSLASIIERKYPIDFDDNIREETEKCDNDDERKRIREFASMTAIGFKHQPLSDRSSLAICLNHPQAQLRIEALQRIREGLQSKQNIEHEFLLDVVQSRLNDNDAKVVQEAVFLLDDLQLIDHQPIHDILQKILQRQNDEWCSVQQSIVRFLARDSTNETRYLHLLFPSNQSELNLLNHLLENYKQQKQSLTPLLKLTKKIFKSATVSTLPTVLQTFLQSISSNEDQTNLLSPLIQQHDEILRLVEHSRPNWIKFAVIYILLGIGTIQHQQNHEYVELSIVMIFKLLKKLSTEISPLTDEQNDLNEAKTLLELHAIKKSPFTAASYTAVWTLFLQALPKDLQNSPFGKDFLSETIQWLCSEEKTTLIHLLLTEQFPSLNTLTLFLAEFFLCPTNHQGEQEVLIKYIMKKSSKFEYTNLSILIFVFLLHSTSRSIRSTTMKIFQNKLKIAADEFEGLFQLIKTHENEILTDAEYICVLISQLIQTTKTSEKKKRKLNAENSTFIRFFKQTIDQHESLTKKFQQQLNIQLLELLKQSHHWSIFYEYFNEFQNLLQQNEQILSQQENKQLIDYVIGHIDYETLTDERSSCFEIILQLFQRSVKKSKSTTTIDMMISTLKQLTPEMFAALATDFDRQMQLIEECFSLWQRSKSAQLTTTIKTTLSKFPLQAKHFLAYWKNLLEPNESTNNQQTRLSNKKLILSKPAESNTNSSPINWKPIVPSLELLHNEQMFIEQRDELIRPIFTMLEKSLNESNESEQNNYVQQLCITALLNLYNQLKSEQCHPESFNSEIVMECLKRTNDLHTTQQSLMLLSKGAQLFPEKLISMIMAMFAFVGDRLVRKDDFYSYQVMEKTIKTVIPSLYKEKNVHQRRSILAKITHVFVTSLAHLPAHRRQDIFRMLMESIGQEECLWFAPVQLFDSILLSPVQKKTEETLKKALIDGSEQMLTSFNQFPPSTIIISLTRILNVVLDLPDQILKNQSTPANYSHLIDLRSYTTKHIHVLKYQLLTFINNVLSAEYFLLMVKKKISQIEKELNELIQMILHCLLWANKLSEDDADISRYNKSILNKIYECLNKSIALLHDSMFVNIISNLLQQQQTNEKLQRKTLEIFNQRLREEFTPENEIVLFLPQIDHLFTIISKSSNHEQEQTAQTALFTIKLLAKRVAEKHPNEFASSLTFICQQLRLVDSGQHANLSASIYLCLAELCATLKVYSVAELPIFMPHVIETFQSDQVTKHDLLLTSVIACLSKLVRTLCNYLTPYLPSIIKRTCTLLTHPLSSNDQRLRTMWSHIALHVPHRLLFPILDDVIKKNEFTLNDLEPLMTLLKQSISIATIEDLTTNYSLLKQLFLKLFTLRTTHSKQMKPNQMNVYEDHIFDCFAELVIRLSEETFRPLFYTIYEWAVYNEPPAEYTLTFYRLTYLLSKKLKGLFTLFAAHIIQHSANVLNQLNTSKSETSTEFRIQFRKKYAEENQLELLNGVLGTLSNLCLFDSVGFITDERFQLLMMPVVDQLENFSSNENYKQWIEQFVSPCIVNLTAATKEETLWRQIHYQILLKTRSDQSKIRLASLHVLQELSRKLAMNYQSLLAEAVPFLAELMEDANDDVEKTVHRVIIDMESTLGESLQDYFNN